jgi:hypothetical protein
MALTRDVIVEVAIRHLDEHGLDALSLRKIAADPAWSVPREFATSTGYELLDHPPPKQQNIACRMGPGSCGTFQVHHDRMRRAGESAYRAGIAKCDGVVVGGPVT